jgi:hypothetical protein
MSCVADVKSGRTFRRHAYEYDAYDRSATQTQERGNRRVGKGYEDAEQQHVMVLLAGWPRGASLRVPAIISSSFKLQTAKLIARPDAPPIEGANGVHSPQAILAAIRAPDASSADLILPVLEAEATHFDATQALELAPLLQRYALDHRDSNDPRVAVAVASAIRKFVAIMPRDNLCSVEALLESGHRVAVSIDVELEVAKMVVRKLTANPPDDADVAIGVANRMKELAETYLNDRIIAREKHGAVALNALLALALLLSPLLADAMKALCGLRSLWFQQLVLRRSRLLREELAARHPRDRIAPHLELLGQVESQLANVMSQG